MVTSVTRPRQCRYGKPAQIRVGYPYERHRVMHALSERVAHVNLKEPQQFEQQHIGSGNGHQIIYWTTSYFCLTTTQMRRCAAFAAGYTMPQCRRWASAGHCGVGDTAGLPSHKVAPNRAAAFPLSHENYRVSAPCSAGQPSPRALSLPVDAWAMAVRQHFPSAQLRQTPSTSIPHIVPRQHS